MEEKEGAAEQIEKAHMEDEEQPQQEVKTEEELRKQVDEEHGQQIPEEPAAEQGEDHKVPVHLGQPEI